MSTELNKAIGKRVRLQREKLRMSREELSERIEVSSRFLADIELGSKGMSFQTLIRLSKVLHVSTDYLLLGKAEANTAESIYEMIKSLDEKSIPKLETIISAYIQTIETE